MSRILVLGGAGVVGSVAVKTLAEQEAVSRVIVGDIHPQRAEALLKSLGNPKIGFCRVDAMDRSSIQEAVAGCDLVLNCIGPFYKTVKQILQAVIAAGVNYVDVCDDVDVTLDILEMNEQARQAGVTALIGMGSSPGATNLLAKYAADHLLDETDSVDIFHAHGGEPHEGEGVVAHRFHCMSIPIPMFLDGRLTHVDYFGADGIALRQTFDFPVLGGGIPLYPYPHPEQVTLPRHLKLRRVTNKGTVLPSAYYDLTSELCRLGLADREPVMVNGRAVIPHDFAVSYIIREREKILAGTGFGGQQGCCSVVVKGKKGGRDEEYRFHMASRSQALGEGTGIPAAIGALLMLEGKITALGVLPPEACVDPVDFIGMVPQVMPLAREKQGGKSFGGVIVERIDSQGTLTTLDI